ncbi:MAG: T9SS type A sorting domain-containing protein [Bacteroidales bacterium]
MKRKLLLMWIVAIVSGMIILPFFSMSQELKSAAQSKEEYFKIIRSNQVTGQIDPRDVLTARQQVESMMKMKSSSALGLNWSGMGPDNLGSRTRSILIDKNTPSTLYAGSVTGGVWKSTTGGSSWSPTAVNGAVEQVINVSCMAQANDGTIYAGTGEGFYSGNGAGKGGIMGQGLFKSTDGNNFTLVAGTQPTANNTSSDWAYINRIAVDQNGRLWVATNTGLKYSDDQGVSWFYAKSNGIDLLDNAWDVKLGTSGLVVACVGNKGYVSDSGDPNAFVNHSETGTGNLPVSTQVSRIEFAIAPSNNNVIYASIAKTNGALLNIYKSADKGLTWIVVGPGGSSSFNLFNTGTVTNTGYGQYANAITVHPTNENMIFAGGANLWKGVKFDEGYYSWIQVTEGAINPAAFIYLHNFHHAYVFHPTNLDIIYIATDGGLSLTTNGGLSFQGINRNYKVTQAYSVAPTYKGQVLLGTQGNGSQYISLEGNTVETATTLNSSEAGGYCAASFINPKAYFVGTMNGQARRSIDRGENFTGFYAANMSNLSGAYITPLTLWESFNDPNSVDSVMFVSYDTILPGAQFIAKSLNGDYPFVTTNEGPTIFPYDTIYITDPVASKLFVGVNGGLWFTKKALDFGGTPVWFKLANFIGTVQSLAHSSDGDNVFMGLQEGQVLRIRNVTSWVSDTSNNIIVDTIFTMANRAITSIAVDPSESNNVVITLGNYGNGDYVYRSVNALASQPTFGMKQGNLPAMPVYASLIEMNNSNKVIIGTEMGVFGTENINDMNPVWEPENAGLANIPVMMLRQQTMHHWPIIDEHDTAFVNNFGMIYAASHGRGIFKCGNFVGIEQPEVPSRIADNQLLIYPNPVVDQATLCYHLSTPGKVNIQILNIMGQVVQEMNFVNQIAGDHSCSLSMDRTLSTGTYMVRLTAGNSVKKAKLVIQ